MNRIVPLALVAALAAPAAMAQDFAPAIVFDMGGKFDKSFNEAAYNGAERFRKETGIAYREFEVTSEAQRDQAQRNLARPGATVIVAVGPDVSTVHDFASDVASTGLPARSTMPLPAAANDSVYVPVAWLRTPRVPSVQS
ncbi:MAG: BMP family ABC transporter substrate-binding protein, partial [Alphaproteobacteria bacterium]